MLFNVHVENYLYGGLRYNEAIASTHSSIVTPGYDPIIGNLMANIVHNGNYAWRIEDLAIGGYVSVITQQINSYFCEDIYFSWLAVLENGGHPANESSLMIIELRDATDNSTLLTRVYNAVGTDNRFNAFGAYFFTPSWQIEQVSIGTSRLGHSFELRILASDCQPTGHRGYVYIDDFGGVPI